MARRIPGEILESPLFKNRLEDIMRGYAGIYALYRKNKIYYIGLTKNLLRRINNHLKDRLKGKWDSFTIFRIHRVRYLKDIETLIQQLVSAPENRVKGHIPKDADLNRILKEILVENERTIKTIRKAFKR
jgi:predicted GIY-YIG superfamily endonuclease